MKMDFSFFILFSFLLKEKGGKERLERKGVLEGKEKEKEALSASISFFYNMMLLISKTDACDKEICASFTQLHLHYIMQRLIKTTLFLLINLLQSRKNLFFSFCFLNQNSLISVFISENFI